VSQPTGIPPESAERVEHLPDRLAQLVNVVFAVVMAESLARFNTEIVSLSPPLILFALLSVYVIAVSSWWGYHRSLSKYRYLDNHLGVARFVVDLFTVVVYVYLIYSVRDVSETGNLVRYISGVPVVFGAYLVSGTIRVLEHRTREASQTGVLVVFALATSALAISYHVFYDADKLAAEEWNWVFVGLTIALVLAFRGWRLIYYAPMLENRR
jgi:phosphatidylserine synthase